MARSPPERNTGDEKERDCWRVFCASKIRDIPTRTLYVHAGNSERQIDISLPRSRCCDELLRGYLDLSLRNNDNSRDNFLVKRVKTSSRVYTCICIYFLIRIVAMFDGSLTNGTDVHGEPVDPRDNSCTRRYYLS